MPTLQQQKVACFGFCNELDLEWGGFVGDECDHRNIKWWQRQRVAEFLALGVGGVIVERFAAAWNAPRDFHISALKCLDRNVRLYVLDISDNEVTTDAAIMRFAKVLAAKYVFAREGTAESNWLPGGSAPLGWMAARTHKKFGQKAVIVPDIAVRKKALEAYSMFIGGMSVDSIHRCLRQKRFIRSVFWVQEAVRYAVCGFPLISSHKMDEVFSGFSWSAWRRRDPEALAALSRICDTFRQERDQLLVTSSLAAELYPRQEQFALAAEAQQEQPCNSPPPPHSASSP